MGPSIERECREQTLVELTIPRAIKGSAAAASPSSSATRAVASSSSFSSTSTLRCKNSLESRSSPANGSTGSSGSTTSASAAASSAGAASAASPSSGLPSSLQSRRVRCGTGAHHAAGLRRPRVAARLPGRSAGAAAGLGTTQRRVSAPSPHASTRMTPFPARPGCSARPPARSDDRCARPLGPVARAPALCGKREAGTHARMMGGWVAGRCPRSRSHGARARTALRHLKAEKPSTAAGSTSARSRSREPAHAERARSRAPSAAAPRDNSQDLRHAHARSDPHRRGGGHHTFPHWHLRLLRPVLTASRTLQSSSG